MAQIKLPDGTTAGKRADSFEGGLAKAAFAGKLDGCVVDLATR